MRRTDEMPLDPEVAASLEAIDATLAGEPVSPSHAELAELALLLRAERPQTSAALAGVLDARVERRFAPPERAPKQRRPRRWWLWTPAAGLAAALAVAIVVVAGGGSSSTESSSTTAAGSSSSGRSASPHSAASSALAPTGAAARATRTTARGVPASGSFKASSPSATPVHSVSSSTPNSSAGQPLAQLTPAPASPVLQPPANGRKIIQGGQLSLVTPSTRIDDVAQEIFIVIGQVHGIVNNSTVTASGGPGGYAQFQLSIPSGSLPQTMAELSSLRYARVASRTDTTQDVNNQYQGDVQRLADARALRTSLLKQLANAVTLGQIDSLNGQIHDAEGAISSDQATLSSLNNQIAYSQVTVTINGGVIAVSSHSGANGSGFTFGKAAHDAGRVLTVAAGIALIGLAALLPVALVAALAWWVVAALRRRRRQQALDAV